MPHFYKKILILPLSKLCIRFNESVFWFWFIGKPTKEEIEIVYYFSFLLVILVLVILVLRFCDPGPDGPLSVSSEIDLVEWSYLRSLIISLSPMTREFLSIFYQG